MNINTLVMAVKTAIHDKVRLGQNWQRARWSNNECAASA
jgi:hypothetical protein